MCRKSHETMLNCSTDLAGEDRTVILLTATPTEEVTFPFWEDMSLFSKLSSLFMYKHWNVTTLSSADHKLTELRSSFTPPLMQHFPWPRNCRPWQTVSGCLKSCYLQRKHALFSFPTCFLTPYCDFLASDASSTGCLLISRAKVHAIWRLNPRTSERLQSWQSESLTSLTLWSR